MNIWNESSELFKSYVKHSLVRAHIHQSHQTNGLIILKLNPRVCMLFAAGL